MRKSFILCLACIAAWGSFVPGSYAVEKRCGWLQNPTPANWWLVDRDGSWTISVQGGYRARGVDTIPDLTRRQYVTTNGSYGYACACLDVTANRKTMKITTIQRVQQLPLSRCRQDQTLPKE